MITVIHGSEPDFLVAITDAGTGEAVTKLTKKNIEVRAYNRGAQRMEKVSDYRWASAGHGYYALELPARFFATLGMGIYEIRTVDGVGAVWRDRWTTISQRMQRSATG